MAEEETFTIDDSDRYSRLRLISWWRQERLSAARVLVVGAGALGNEVLKNLALLGVRNILVIDLDRVERTNLSRSVLFRESDEGAPKAEAAARALNDLNPEVRVQALTGNVMADLGLETIAAMDLVFGCLDNREARLWLNQACWKTGTPWIDAGIQEISGVVKVYVPPDSSCYECTMTEADYRLINLRYSCPLLKREDIQEGKVPTAPTISSIIAGLQTQEGLKLLHGMQQGAGKAMVFSGEGAGFYVTGLPRREDCLSHQTYPPRRVLEGSREEVTAQQILDESGRDLSGDVKLVLERDLLTSLTCSACELILPVMRPRVKVSQSDGVCESCGEVMELELVHEVEAGSALARRSLHELGVPPYDILRVTNGSDSRFYCLTGDRVEALGRLAEEIEKE